MRKITALLIVLSICASSLVMLTSQDASATALTPNIKVNDDGFTGTKATVDMSMHNSGRAIVVWDEKRYNDRNIYLAYSSDNATGFSSDSVVNTMWGGDQVSPAVATGDGNEVYVVWQDEKNGTKIFMGKSDDLGRTFSEEVRVSNNDFGYEKWPDVAVNGQTVAVVWRDSGSDNAVRIWNPDSGELVRTLTGHDAAVLGVGFSPSGANMATCSEAGDIILWDTGTWEITQKITPHRDYATSIDWSPDGSSIVSSSWDVVDRLDGDGNVVLNPYTGTPTSDILIMNSASLAVTRLLNETNGTRLLNPVNDVVYSPDGSQIAAAYNGREITAGVPTGNPNRFFNVTVWNTSNWSSWTREKDLGGGHEGSVMSVAFNPNGTMLASSSSGSVAPTQYTVKVWNSQTGTKVAEYANLGTVNDVTWSPNGTYIAAGLSNGTVALFNYSNYSEIFWLKGHNGRVNGLDWNSARDQLVTGASDPKAKIWDVDSGVDVQNLTGHAFSVHDTEWSPDGNIVATVSGNAGGGVSEYQIYCAVSTDGGASFGDAVPVSDTLGGEKQYPKVAIDSSNVISVVWFDNRNGGDDIWFSNSTDLGASFGKNVGISTDSGRSEYNPSLDVDDGGTVHIVWQWQKNTGDPPIFDIKYSNSTDGFSSSRAINHTVGSQQQMPSVAVRPDGSDLYVSWADNRDGEYEIYLSNSTNGGSSFGGAQKVSDPATDDKYKVVASVDVYGHLGMAWPDNRNGEQNIYFSGSQQTDETAPTIIDTLPEDGASNESIFTSMMIYFSEPMSKSSVESAFSFTDGTNTYDAGDCRITWSEYGDIVFFEPLEPLEYHTTYTATMDAGPLDRAGLSLAVGATWSFTTGGDVDPPEIMPSVTLEFSTETYSVVAGSITEINYDDDLNVRATIVDHYGEVSAASLFYRGVGSITYTEVGMAITGVDEYSATIPSQWAIGNITFYIYAIDIEGNSAISDNYTCRVVDMTKPVVTVPDIKEWGVNEPIDLTVQVSDFGNVDVKVFYKKAIELDYESMNMTNTRAVGNYSAVLPAVNDIGVLEFYVMAVDDFGNNMSSLVKRVSILDLKSPVINMTLPRNLENKDIIITAEVTDNVAVSDVNLYFKAVGSDIWVKRIMSVENGTDTYTYIIPAQTKSGTIYYYINATDTSGNTASTLDDIQDFGHEWPVKGTQFDWTPYFLAVLVAALAAIAYTIYNKSRGKGSRDDDEWLGPVDDSGGTGTLPENAPAEDGESMDGPAGEMNEGAPEKRREEGRPE